MSVGRLGLTRMAFVNHSIFQAKCWHTRYKIKFIRVLLFLCIYFYHTNIALEGEKGEMKNENEAKHSAAKCKQI